MPVDFEESRGLIVEIKESDVINAMVGIHVLVEPEHHPLLKKWAEEVMGVLTEGERDLLLLLKDWYGQGLKMFDLLLHIKIFSDVEHFSNAVMNLRKDAFLKILFEELAEEDVFKAMREKAHLISLMEQQPYVFGCTLDVAAEIFYNTDVFRERYIGLLQTVHPFTLRFMEQKRGELEKMCTQVKIMLQEDSALEVCQKIMGKRFQRVSNYQRYFFCPTALIVPHRFRLFTNDFVILIFGPGWDTRDGAIEQVKKNVKALDDETRLKIIRALVADRSYGKVLAENLNLTTATVSHHLELLRQAGLLVEEKVGNIKYFRVSEEAVKVCLQEIEDYILNKKS